MSEYLDKFISNTVRNEGQVYARNKETGETFFIPDRLFSGSYRKRFQEKYACIHEDCQSRIALRSGESTRAHYYHLDTERMSHPGFYKESENHSMGKELISSFLTGEAVSNQNEHDLAEYFLPDWMVSKEYRGLNSNRVPDVFATDNEDFRLAFEIEYKKDNPGEREKKNNDLFEDGVIVQWILGHTKISKPKPKGFRNNQEGIVVVDDPAREIAGKQVAVLVLNPHSKQVGTLLKSTRKSIWDGVGGGNRDELPHVYISMDNWEDCEFSIYMGIITPTMMEIIGFQDRDDILRREDRWQNSKWFSLYQDHFNTDLVVGTRQYRYIDALPIHWHYTIYGELIHNQSGRIITFSDIWEALKINNIKKNIFTASEGKGMGSSFRSFIGLLESRGVLQKVSNGEWEVVKNIERQGSFSGNRSIP